MKISIVTPVFLLSLFFLWGCGKTSNLVQPDLIITNANIYTGETEQPSAEAIAIKADTILAIGSGEEIQKLAGSNTTIIDADGRLMLPGFIDTHVHFFSGSYGLSSVQLRDAPTPEVFSQRIGEFAAAQEPGAWVEEGAWDHEMWGGELPKKEWIDSVTSENPVFITRYDGHMALVNSLVLEMAGIDANTPEVEGGTIVRDDQGNPTGILKDNAMSLVYKVKPAPSQKQVDDAFKAGIDFMISNGVTTVHDMDISRPSVLERFQRASEWQKKIRFYVALGLPYWQQLDSIIKVEGKGDEWFKIGAVKIQVDGSLGSHTAAFFEGYTDQPKDSGFFLFQPEYLRKNLISADSAGLQLTIHSIGDKANNLLLNIYEEIISLNGERERRFRIEHAQHLISSDIARFQKLGVIASVQPYHAIDDGRWAEKIIGPERIKTTYAFKSLYDQGAMLAFGSDWPVAPATPLEGIYAAVTRQTLDGENPEGWVPEEKVSVETAVEAYTKNAAFSSFSESKTGTLRTGKLADLIVLDKNIFEINHEEIRDAKVLMTVIGGQIMMDKIN